MYVSKTACSSSRMAGFAEGFLFFCLLKTQRQHHQVFKPIIIMVAGGKLYLIVLVWSSVYLPVRVGPTAKVQPIELRLQMDLLRECPQSSVVLYYECECWCKSSLGNHIQWYHLETITDRYGVGCGSIYCIRRLYQWQTLIKYTSGPTEIAKSCFFICVPNKIDVQQTTVSFVEK